MTITRQTVIGDILDTDNSVAPLFLAIGMHCLGCPASRGETIEQACAVHGTDADELVAKLNAHFGNAWGAPAGRPPCRRGPAGAARRRRGGHRL